MIRTGKEYRDSIRDGREVHMNGERIRDVVDAIPPSSRWSISAPASTTWRTSRKLAMS